MSADPARSDVNAIDLPSLETDAFMSRKPSGWKGFGLLPSASATKIFALSGRKLANAIEYAGCSLTAENAGHTINNPSKLQIKRIAILSIDPFLGRDLAWIHAQFEQGRPPGLKSALKCFWKGLRCFNLLGVNSVCLGQRDEVRIHEVGGRNPSGESAFLMHADSAVHSVAHHYHEDGGAVLHSRGEFLRVHQETAIAGEANGDSLGIP